MDVEIKKKDTVRSLLKENYIYKIMNLYFIDGILITAKGIYTLLKDNNIKKTVNEINNVYTLNFIERILLYSFTQMFFPIYISSLFVIPKFQNWLVSFVYTTYQEEKYKLIKFLISKNIVRYFQSLFHISNYQIFKVYMVLSYDFFIKALQNALFIFVVYLLKRSEKTYLYYKIIKYHAFVSSYYTFTISNVEQANEMLHDMILESRWTSLNDIEIVHALFILSHSNLLKYLPSTNDPFFTKLQFLYFKLWISYYIYLFLSSSDLKLTIPVMIYLEYYRGYNLSKYLVAMFTPSSFLALVIVYFYDSICIMLKDISFYFTYKQEINKVIRSQKAIC
jgi:hypothetical protein